jgi:hypothetical protein
VTKFSYPFLTAFVVVSLVLGACAPKYVISPPAIDSSKFSHELLAENKVWAGYFQVDEAFSSCPAFQSDDLIDDPKLMDSIVYLCKLSDSVDSASITLAGAMIIPATVEPTVVGEGAIGVVIVAGKVVAVVAISAAVAALAIHQLTQPLVEMRPVDVPIPDWTNGFKGVPLPKVLVSPVVKPTSHASVKHGYEVVKCFASLITTNAPVRIYYAPQTLKPDAAGEYFPALALTWPLALLAEKIANAADCANLSAELAPLGYTIENASIVVIVKISNDGDKFIPSMYPSFTIELNRYLCTWGFFYRLAPKAGIVNCSQ